MNNSRNFRDNAPADVSQKHDEVIKRLYEHQSFVHLKKRISLENVMLEQIAINRLASDRRFLEMRKEES